MNILVVSQYFWPENFRVNDLCAEMVARGHSVTVLTGEPNYTTGRLDQDYLKNKDEYSSYKGCEVIRVPLVERGENNLRLILNYISYFVTASTFGIWKIRGKSFDVVFVCQLSPVTIALPAIVYRRLYGAPVIMWVLDLWPDSLKAVGIIKSKIVIGLINRLVRFIYDRCDLILCQSRSFVGSIKGNSSANSVVDYFPSWAEPIFNGAVVEAKEFDLGCKSFNVVFAGNVGEAQDFPTAIEAMEILKARCLNVRLHIVGDGRYLSKLRDEVLDKNLTDYFEFWGRYPLGDMPSFYCAADALFVSLKSSPAFSMTIPGKVQSYMMAGKPILASLEGEGRQAILQSGCGLVSDPGDSNTLADNIDAMLNLPSQQLLKMGANGKEYAETEFNREALINKLFDHFETIAK